MPRPQPNGDAYRRATPTEDDWYAREDLDGDPETFPEGWAELIAAAHQSGYQRVELEAFFSKVAGVSHPNDDGTSRQAVIAECRIGDMLRLERDPGNIHDPYAVKVFRDDGRQLGWLTRIAARDVSAAIHQGAHSTAEITDITGGTDDKPTRGVNIKLRADG